MTQPKLTFLLERLQTLQNLANWPSAKVPVTALVTEYIPELCKVPYDYLFRHNGQAMAECTLLVQDYLNLDILTANMDVYNFEAEAMGAKIKFFPDHCPDFDRSDYFIKDPSDLNKIRFGGLDQGRFPYLIQYCKAYKHYTGVDTFPIFSAPWTLAGNLYGIENLIMATIEDPEFVHEFLRRIVDDYHVPMFHALNDAVPGFAEMDFVDAFASVPMVNVSIVNEFIRPYLQRELDKLNMPRIRLMDTAFFGTAMLEGKDRESFEDFIIWSNGRFLCIDPDAATLGADYAREVATRHMTPLQIGISATYLEFESIDNIVALVRDYVLKAKSGPTPAIFFFNNISPCTEQEKIQAAVQAVKIYGAPGADADTPYQIPEFRSFEEFLKYKLKNNPEEYTFEWVKQSAYSYLL
ncbi:uroporphyrinogen decarboxylase family protein [Blautia producta]|uniref:uroporphyrinogen decarboxylase family protein n=1 Tax=Blautia producta TaxID=33035 RepID=UPI0031B6343F